MREADLRLQKYQWTGYWGHCKRQNPPPILPSSFLPEGSGRLLPRLGVVPGEKSRTWCNIPTHAYIAQLILLVPNPPVIP